MCFCPCFSRSRRTFFRTHHPIYHLCDVRKRLRLLAHDREARLRGLFRRLPSYWNIVVFYLFLLSSPPLLNTVLVVALAFLVFIPVRFLYVSRLRRSRLLHFGLSAVWGLACLVALFLDAGTLRNAFLYVSLVYPVFYTAHSVLLDVRDRQKRTALG